MGFLSFLSRKPTGESPHQPTPLPSQAYHATTARSPPFRGKHSVDETLFNTPARHTYSSPGAYPVAGNGPTTLETLSRAGARLDRAPARDSALSGYFAPDHAIPDIAGEGSGRPSTAPEEEWPQYEPIQAAEKTDHPARLKKNPSSGRSIPISWKKPRDSSAVSSPRGSRSSSIVTAVPDSGQPARFPFVFPHSKSSSLKSDPRKGFKDILDAQSEFRPADFKSRVKAAGARDYGEDVADRNIDVNGASSNKPKHMSFSYSHQSGGHFPPRDQWASMAGGPLRSPDMHASNAPSSRNFHQSVPRTFSPDPQNRHAFPRRITSHIPPVPALENHHAHGRVPQDTEKKNRRQTLTYYPVTRSLLPTNDDTQRSASHGRQNAEVRAYIPSSPRIQEIDADPSTRSRRWRREVASLPAPRKRPGVRGPESPRQPRDSVLLAKNKRANNDAGHTDNDNPQYASAQERDRSSTPKPRTGNNSTARSQVLTNGRRHSLQPLRPSTRTGLVTHVPSSPQIRSVQNGGESRPASSQRDTDADTLSTVDCAPYPFIRTGIKPHEGVNGSSGYKRAKSFTQSLQRFKLDDYPEADLIKAASARHWSISSATPTSSDASSNPFPRPQSHHTANTSLDLGNGFSIKNGSRTSLPSNAASPNAARHPATNNPTAFNIDDYISSDDDDDDSTTPQRRPRGEGEEDLLFQDDGYGMGGSQLPGLFDALTAPPPVSPLGPGTQEFHEAALDASAAPESTQASYGGPLFDMVLSPFQGPRRYIIDTAAHYEDEDDDIDSGEYTDDWYDGTRDLQSPMMSPIRGVRGTKRLSALGALPDLPSLSDDDAVKAESDSKATDVSIAARRRKEKMARRRATLTVDTRRRSRPDSEGQATLRGVDVGEHTD